MGRYNFVSPGAEAGQSVLDILTQRRAEARQAMIDDITAKNAEVQRRATEAQMASQQQADELAKINEAKQGLQMGEQPPAAVRGLFEKYGLSRPASVGEAPAEPTPFQTPPPGETEQGIAGPLDLGGTAAPVKPTLNPGGYIGTQEQQDEAERAKALDTIGPLLADPNASYLEKMLAVTKALKMPTLPGTAFTAMQPERPYFRLDEATGKTSPIVGPDNKPLTAPPGDSPLVRISRPPNTPRDTGTYLGPATDEKGNVVPGKAVVMRNGQITVEDLPVAGIGARTPRAPGKLPDLIPAATSRQLAIARGVALTAGAPPDAYNKYTEMARNAIAAAKVSDPSIAKAAINIVIDQVNPVTGELLVDDKGNFLPGTSVQEIGDQMLQAGATQDEVNQVIALVLQTGGH